MVGIVAVNAERANWAGNVIFAAARIHHPSSVGAVQSVVARESRVRALGSRHSFSDLADSPGSLVSLAGLPRMLEVDSAAAAVKVAAGMRYAELGEVLHRHGWALHNLGSLPHISVAGACATATHGSGVANGNLATAVAAMEMITAEGDLVTLSRAAGGSGFEGTVVGLGALGIVVSLTLDLIPTFRLRQEVFEGLPLAAVATHLADILGGAYSVSLFTDWREAAFNVWVKYTDGGARPAVVTAPWFEAAPADGPRHPIPGLPAINCTGQMGVPGPWYERLPHFRPDSTPSAGRELQSEYLIPASAAVDALRALDRVRDRIHPVLQICEVRAVAADSLWLSPSYQRDTVAIHFTWTADLAAARPAIEVAERELASFQPRPHWGKIFGIAPAAVRAQYPRLGDFLELAARYDPHGKFGNAFTGRYLGGG